MSDRQAHVVFCGYDPLARSALAELLGASRTVALLCESHDEELRARSVHGSHPDLVIVRGHPTHECLRASLHAERAEAIVIAMGDDEKNLVAALNARAVSPHARVIVALRRADLRQTLEASGITYIVSPLELSGRLIASAAFEPEVAALLEDLVSGVEGEVDMQQYVAGDLGGCSVREVRARLAAINGPLLVALAKRTPDGFRIVARPRASMEVDAQDVLIVMAGHGDAERLAEAYGLTQGRQDSRARTLSSAHWRVRAPSGLR
jgi:Trk K+ transport system NAD-binding subunit